MNFCCLQNSNHFHTLVQYNRSIFVSWLSARKKTACTCARHGLRGLHACTLGQSNRRVPPAPIRTPERSSRIGGSRRIFGTAHKAVYCQYIIRLPDTPTSSHFSFKVPFQLGVPSRKFLYYTPRYSLLLHRAQRQGVVRKNGTQKSIGPLVAYIF